MWILKFFRKKRFYDDVERREAGKEVRMSILRLGLVFAVLFIGRIGGVNGDEDEVRSVEDVHSTIEKKMTLFSVKMEGIASELESTMKRHEIRVTRLEKKRDRVLNVNGDKSKYAYQPHRTWLWPFLFISCALLFLLLFGLNRYRFLLKFDFGLLGEPAYKMT